MNHEFNEASIFSALYAASRQSQGAEGSGSKSKRRSAGEAGGAGGIKGLNARTGSIRFGKAMKGFYSPPGSSTRINPIAKLSYVKNNKDSYRHIIQHCHYLEFRERGPNEAERQWHTRDRDNVPGEEVIQELLENRGSKVAMFKIILSPNNNELNHEDMARQVMGDWQEKIGLNIDYAFVKHSNTAHIHMHFLLHGTTVEGKDYRIERADIQNLRELAFQYQYEIEYELVKDNYHMQQEIQAWREDQQRSHEFFKNLELLKELDLYRPEYDKQVQEDLGINKYYHLENVWLPPDAEHIAFMDQLQKDHPELFPGLSAAAGEGNGVAQELTDVLFADTMNPEWEVIEREKPEPSKDDREVSPERFHPVVARLYDHGENEPSPDIDVQRLTETFIELTYSADQKTERDRAQSPEFDDSERDETKSKNPIFFLLLSAQIDDQGQIESAPREVSIWEATTGESEEVISTDAVESDHWQDEYAFESVIEQTEQLIETQTIESTTDDSDDDRERDEEDW